MRKDSGAAGLALLSPELLTAIWNARADDASYVRANVLTLLGTAVGWIDDAAPLAKLVLDEVVGGAAAALTELAVGMKDGEAFVRRAALDAARCTATSTSLARP